MANIDMGLGTRTAGKHTFIKALATVTIIDSEALRLMGQRCMVLGVALLLIPIPGALIEMVK